MWCRRQKTIRFLKKDCPHIWALLNQRARLTPPNGFTEFIYGDWAVEGRRLLRLTDARVHNLIMRTSAKAVGDAFRRDISGVDSQDKLAELLCEMMLIDALGMISSTPPIFRPKTDTGTACDVRVAVDGNDLYGEAKRFADTWEGGKRSIAKSPAGSAKPDADRPRSMDLYAKMKCVYKQFPKGTLNVLFLFHPSVWNTHTYIRQALFGDASSLDESVALSGDGLFALSEWQKISACVLCRVNCDGTISIGKIWRNLKAGVVLPDSVGERLASVR